MTNRRRGQVVIAMGIVGLLLGVAALSVGLHAHRSIPVLIGEAAVIPMAGYAVLAGNILRKAPDRQQ